MLRKILIANRGEIAVRIIRSCRDLKIPTVAVFADADRTALHVKMADEAVPLGASTASESYLRIDKIIDAAKECGADAIHPGYGFLAENYRFAAACEDAGLTFIGPSAQSLELMGDKIASRRAVEAAGVPVIPGSTGKLATLEEGLAIAAAIGYPLLIKASAGGGGKGIRTVRGPEELASSLEIARQEALSTFGDQTVYVEKFLEKPRHIEIQVLGDKQGNVVHLGERECSIQRRHQKLVEESPSPAVDSALREKLGNAAIAVARAANYHNAGTVEFLVDAVGPCDRWKYYFLEMNTRLQVEHPVTELVTGLDLVSEQIRLACGEELGLRQDAIPFHGAAIEVRICAEDPFRGFAPCPGTISLLFEPSGPGIRNDSGVCEGFTVPVEYDPLISKLIAYGRNRTEALSRMKRALLEYRIAGIETTVPFFHRLLQHPQFVAGEIHTRFVELMGLSDLEMAETETEPALVPLVASALVQKLSAPGQREPQRRGRSRWRESVEEGWR